MHTIKQIESVNEALSDIAMGLLIRGDLVPVVSSTGQTKDTLELLDYNVKFKPGYNNIVTLPVRKFPVRGACAEFLWYMTGNEHVAPILPYLPNWEYFSTNGKVNSNYGKYWLASLRYIVQELVRDNYSRRAVISIYNVDNADEFHKDTPCTLSLQFLIRKGKLHMLCNMRSNDCWTGFCIDQFCNSLLHQLVLHELKDLGVNVELGMYSHSTASMHAYLDRVDRNMLRDTFNNYNSSDKLADARLSIPEHINLTNFWKHADEVFAEDLVDHFRKYIAAAY